MEDCYYFMTATCSKGASCPFRHCEAAKEATSICPAWLAGGPGCTDTNCTLRHSTFSVKKRSEIECYWQGHGGCKKTDCPFKHTTVAGKAPSVPASGAFVIGPKATQSAPTGTPVGAPKTMATAPPSPALATAASKDSLVDQGRKKSLNFEVKSFDEIMKEKKRKLHPPSTSPGTPAEKTPIPVEGTLLPPIGSARSIPLPIASAEPSPTASHGPAATVKKKSITTTTAAEPIPEQSARKTQPAASAADGPSSKRTPSVSKSTSSILDDDAIDEQFAEIERLINS